ncbi:acyl-CoA thioesterase [Demequina zhanjiangensis]|uniref:Thioesterase family protein n=1 Tax=Demequina zhanjiangensis TaxID=3051659 RepID=A0ABT8G107_9MICO|nr:thioesterase family protein [Demequina sp. SYSU T00b26]MDN4472629.1 thioesterase family protein [Demequina sp. SYSU T00b26]
MPRLTFPVHLRWADLDPNGHVNNVAYLTILEDVRIRGLHPILGTLADERGALRSAGRPPVVVARHEIDYVQQMPWSPHPVLVDLWVSRIGGSSIDICHVMRTEHGGQDTVYARVVSVLVYLDPDTQRPRPLSDHEREMLEAITDAPLPQRTRAAVGSPP